MPLLGANGVVLPMVHVVLVSGWQTVNIGDVAHSPGVLEAFRRFAPDTRLTLWARNIDEAVRELLARYYPEVGLVEERVGDDGSITPELERLFGEADLLVHGSGPSLVGKAETAAWRAHTDKPYGFFGVTVDPLRPYDGTLERSAAMIDAIRGDLLAPLDRELLTDAAFVYCRDSLTRRFLQGQGIGVAELEFGADGTVIFDVVDDDHGAPVLSRVRPDRGSVPVRCAAAALHAVLQDPRLRTEGRGLAQGGLQRRLCGLRP